MVSRLRCIALATLLCLLALAIRSGTSVEPTEKAQAAEVASVFSPPRLIDPVTVEVTSEDRKVNLLDGQDAIIDMGDVEGPVRIVGGRNVKLIGGHISIPFAGQLEDYGSPGSFISARLGLYLKGQTGTVHVEGVLFDGPDLSEGIQINAPEAVVQLVNLRFEGIHARDEVSFTDNHPDVIQPWGGVRVLRIDGLTASSDMQGIFLKGDTGPIGEADIRRVNLKGTSTARQLFWQAETLPVHLENVFIQGAPGRYFGTIIWPQYDGSYPRRSFKTPDGRWMFYPETGITGAIVEGSPPSDFVPRSLVGATYER